MNLDKLIPEKISFDEVVPEIVDFPKNRTGN